MDLIVLLDNSESVTGARLGGGVKFRQLMEFTKALCVRRLRQQAASARAGCTRGVGM